MKYISVTVNTDHQSAELISSAFFDVGASGVSILDKQDFLELVKSDVIWDYVDESVLSQTDTVRVSTVVDPSDTDFTIRLAERLDEMKAYGVRFGEMLIGEVNEADWENEWKKYYKPIKTSHITVVPTWYNYQPSEGELIMRLDPGMAFGTGEHATTRMCLELMDVKGKSVLDVGCGSGILGIAAALSGATDVYMCDIDEQAVKFATENARLNSVDATVECADLLQGDRCADFIFANLTADILMRFSKTIGEHLNEGGVIALSGIINTRLDEVKACYFAVGYKKIQEKQEGDWCALLLTK